MAIKVIGLPGLGHFAEKLLEYIKFHLRITEQKYTFTTKAETANVVFTIPNFDSNVDKLDIYVNGLHLIEGTDYSLNGSTLVLTRPVDANNEIHFVCKRITIA